MSLISFLFFDDNQINVNITQIFSQQDNDQNFMKFLSMAMR